MNYQSKTFHANSIDDVIDELERIIIWAKENNSQLGYFPALYKRVTEKVRTGVFLEKFEDNPRMEKLDILFAKRYIDAFHQFQAGEPCSKSWNVVFQQAENKELTVLQHLSLGMNAHINLDLGIVGGTVSPQEDVQNLKNDFYEINDLLFALIDDVQDQLSEIWKPLKYIDALLGRIDERFAEFSMGQFRSEAWEVAQKVASFETEEARNQYITELDEKVAQFSEYFSKPIRSINAIAQAVRDGEVGEPREIIAILDRNLKQG